MTELKIISMDDVIAEDVEWLWYPYIPYGKLTIIHGDGGEGKTTQILRLAALLSKGEKLPCDDTEREPINIIYQTAEDGLVQLKLDDDKYICLPVMRIAHASR